MIIAHWESVGTAGRMVNVALAAAALLPLLVCKALAASVLRGLAGENPVTLTVTVQEPGAPPGIELPADKVIVFPLGTADTTPPPQVVLAFGALAINAPLGKESVSAAVKLAAATLGLVKVMVRVETPPALMLVGLNALVSVGGSGGGRRCCIHR